MPGSKFQYMFDPFWDLELGTWNLELGTWNLELGIYKRGCLKSQTIIVVNDFATTNGAVSQQDKIEFVSY
jgi:hypothetical protein